MHPPKILNLVLKPKRKDPAGKPGRTSKVWYRHKTNNLKYCASAKMKYPAKNNRVTYLSAIENYNSIYAKKTIPDVTQP